MAEQSQGYGVVSDGASSVDFLLVKQELTDHAILMPLSQVNVTFQKHSVHAYGESS